MSFLTNLFGDGKIGGMLAAVIGLCILGLIIVYAWRAFGRGIRPGSARGARQPRLGIVDAFDLDRHRQLVLVRRDNIEHLIMIGGPNDLLIEEAIVRAQPAGMEGRREPGLQAPGTARPLSPLEPTLEPGEGPRPEPVRVPAFDMAPPPVPPLRPSIEPGPALETAPRPAAAVARPVPPPPPRTPQPLRPVTPVPPRMNPTPVAPPRPTPVPPPVVAPPPPVAPVAVAANPAEPGPATTPAVEPPKEAGKEAHPGVQQRLAVNIDSLEEEMAKLLGRPPAEPPKG